MTDPQATTATVTAGTAFDDPLARLRWAVDQAVDLTATMIGGSVAEIAADACQVSGLSDFARIGDVVAFDTARGRILGQVLRVGPDTVTVKPFGAMGDIGIGARAWHHGSLGIRPDTSWKGRAINALGEPIDNLGPLRQGPARRPLHGSPPAALKRRRVTEPLRTGIKVIDIFTPLCRGQRIGIFAGSGIGKSTLLQMLAASPDFDTAVIALVGERGREVREFLEDGLSTIADRTVAVISTSDESSMLRRLAPATAVTVAEHFRDQGDNVILIVDSITRFAHASRDAAMAAGEPPVARGYTPSVFSDMACLLERSGPGEEGRGTITGVFAVLVDGDDHDEPVADTIRGTLDGHIVLDRGLAEQGRFPAVDPLKSISRLAPKVWSPEQLKLTQSLRSMIARFEDSRDLRLLGGYTKGADPLIDQAVALVPALYESLQQLPDEPPCPDAYRAVATALSGDGSAPA